MDKKISTFEREMFDNKFKEEFENEYKEFNLSETVLELMQRKKISIKALAEKAYLSPTIIQEVKSGLRKHVAFTTALQILIALDCKLEVIDGNKHIPLTYK